MTTAQMIPPSDGSRDSVFVDGRTYSSLPNMAIPVPSFDVPSLQANGWTVVQGQILSGGPGETWAARFRRLAVSARYKNPVESPNLTGSVPWTASTAFAAGSVVSNSGNVYICITAGTSAASGGPAGRVFNTTDGTAHWDWIGLQTAPEVSISTSHNSALTNSYTITSTNYTDNAGQFRWTGGVPIAHLGNDCSMQSLLLPSADPGNITGNAQGYYQGMTFVLEGTKVEIPMFATDTYPMSIIVDGKYIDYTFAASSGGQIYLTLDFTNSSSTGSPQQAAGQMAITGRQRHTITIETPNNFGLQGANVAVTDSIYYPDALDNFSVALLGDSQVGTSGSGYVLGAYGVRMMHMLGLPDIMLCSIGGCGISNAGTATPSVYGKYISRIPDLQRLNSFRPLGLIFVQLSQNDNPWAPGTTGITTTQLAADAKTLFASLRAAFPGVPICALGNITGGGITSGNGTTGANLATIQGMESVVFGAISTQQAAGDALLFTVPAATDPQGPWITGTGHVGAPNGSGTSDYDIGTDGAHLSVAGDDLYARRAVAGFLKIIAGIP